MELIDKIKKNENLYYKILFILLYPLIIVLGLMVIIFAGIISLFQKKETKENFIENTTEEWTFFTEYKNFKILKKYIHEIRFGPAYFALKSEPENPNFKNKIFGDWFYKYENLIFLQQWNSTKTPNTNLLLFNAETNELKTLEENIDSVFWEMKNENEEYLNLFYNTGNYIKTFRIKKNCT